MALPVLSPTRSSRATNIIMLARKAATGFLLSGSALLLLTIKGMDETTVYRCYDGNLKDFLLKNGLRYLVVARDIKNSDAIFWLFEKTARFSLLLQQWKEHK